MEFMDQTLILLYVNLCNMKYETCIYIYIYMNELQPKFRLMESSIRAVSIFWKLSWGLDNDNTLFKK